MNTEEKNLSQDKKTSNSKGKVIFIILGVVLILGLIVGGIFFLKKTEKVDEPKPTVGSIDRDQILENEEYKKAIEEADNKKTEYEKKFAELTKNLDEKNEQDLQKIEELRMEYQNKLLEETNRIINPAYDRAANAVAHVALEKELNVVLDKKIVVCGAVDITADVLKYLKENKEIKKPSAEDTDKMSEACTIGYFDQNVVVSLGDFRKGEETMQKFLYEMDLEFQKQISQISSPQEQMQLQYEFQMKAEKFKNDLFAPIFRKVTRTVEKVAEEENMDLVVSKEYVMYGGKNLTDQVVRKFLGSTGEEDAVTPTVSPASTGN